jgi:hypothetical protein
MARQRPALGTPFGADGPWLAAIVDVLADLHDLLDARLPQPANNDNGGPVRISEPAPAGPPPKAVPVSEPAPDGPPEEEAEAVTEPAPDLPDPPPRAGRGSSLAAWTSWAQRADVAVTDGMSRDDIINACISAGVLSR